MRRVQRELMLHAGGEERDDDPACPADCSCPQRVSSTGVSQVFACHTVSETPALTRSLPATQCSETPALTGTVFNIFLVVFFSLFVPLLGLRPRVYREVCFGPYVVADFIFNY